MLEGWRADEKASRMPILMGIINATPDSFSDGGVNFERSHAVATGRRLVEEGAEILDIGGESTRPGGERVPAEEEERRILPVLSALAGGRAILSVDTVKAKVAEAALQAGAEIVNDVQGLKGEPELAEVAASSGAGLVIMHNPALFGARTGTQGDPVAACLAFFEGSLEIAARAGVKEDRIALDPGFGFGKSVEQNLALLARLAELSPLGFPLLVGTSRKTFIGRVTGREVDARLFGTLATGIAAAERGAAILRVHDVAAHADALKMISAIESEAGPWRER
ncbi:dihydropteroate synthase [Afifella sp. IM 167]|nr:dihydropteroate synthase [Afifella sp. IM 167]